MSCPVGHAYAYSAENSDSYKVGDSFVRLPLPEAQEMLSSATTDVDEQVSKLEDDLSAIRDEMKGLKAKLYARFGRGINLET